MPGNDEKSSRHFFIRFLATFVPEKIDIAQVTDK